MNNFKYPILNIKNISDNLSIDLASVKNFLKVECIDDDNLIMRLIKTATRECEIQINKTLIEKTYIYSIYSLKSNRIELPFPPIKSITSVKITDFDGNSEILNINNYYFDLITGVLNFKGILTNFYRIDIEYIAGLDEINEELIQAILMHVATMYDNRDGSNDIPLGSLNIYKKYKQIKI